MDHLSTLATVATASTQENSFQIYTIPAYGDSPSVHNASRDKNYDENASIGTEKSAKSGEISNLNEENIAPRLSHHLSSDALKLELANWKKEEKEKKDRLREEEKQKKERLKEEEKQKKERLKEEERIKKEEEKRRKVEEKEMERAEKRKKKTRRKKGSSRKSERQLKLKQTVSRNWKDDGSLDILIEWLSDHGNYNRWKGGHGQTGETKDNLAEEIAAKLAQHGKLGRTADAVRAKITWLEKSYRSARDWKARTGSGIMEDELLDMDNRISQVDAYMKRACLHFDLLHPVFGDRPSSRPLLTSDNLMDDSSDSSSKENETSDSSQSKVIATPSPKVPMIASPRRSKTANQSVAKSRLSALDADRVAAIKAQQEIAREEALHHIEVERVKLSVEKEKLQAMLERVQTQHQMKTMLTKSRLDELFPELASDEENL
ncbi:hypothetical protein HDU80_002438 [Chytriomyces hyalinus]|nr:hypothetical protein HDU80_002438 [Chytriomyces hyalinus]